MIKKTAILLIALIAFGTVDMSADNFLDKVKKEAKEQVEKSKKKKSSKKTTTKNNVSKNSKSSQKTQKGYMQWEEERAAKAKAQETGYNSLPHTHHALFEPLGNDVAADKGTQAPKLVMPKNKSISAQAKWLNEQPTVDMLTNERVYEEYIALQNYNETLTEQTEGVFVRIDLLQRALNDRANAINSFVKAINKVHQKQARGLTDEREYTGEKITIKRQISTEGYHTAIRSSLEGLKIYLSPEAIKYFEERGGLDKAHLGARTHWE